MSPNTRRSGPAGCQGPPSSGRAIRLITAATALVALGCTGAIPGPAGNAPGGGNGGPGGGGATPGPSMVPPSASAVPAGLRRLTGTQYRNTIRDLLGASVKLPTELDRDDPEATFNSVGGYRITTSPAGVAKYEDAAVDIAHQVFADPALAASVVGCDVKDGACAARFIKGFGRRAWRRPLTDAEVGRYTKLIDDVSKLLGTPEAGFQHALAGLLQSMNFMYLPEGGEVDAAGKARFTSHEMASRLAYLLTDAPPDPELSAAADRNELVASDGAALKAHFDRLVGSAKAKPTLVGFFGQLLQLSELDDLAKDTAVYPQASPALFAAMRQEAERLIDETAFVRRGALLDLFDLRTAYVNADLAKLYGLPAPAGTGAQPVDLPPATERAGILTTGAFLAVQAKPYSSSPTYRGVWVRERMLCQDVPPPPPMANNVLPNLTERAMAGPPRTTRQVLEDHRKEPACATCHSIFDPIGVAFEKFDGVGAYRTTEEKLPIVTSGNLDGKPYSNVSELLTLLKADARVTDCLVRHLYHYLTGHERLKGEDDVIKTLAPSFRDKPDFRDALARMVMSDFFRSPGAPL